MLTNYSSSGCNVKQANIITEPYAVKVSLYYNNKVQQNINIIKILILV